MPTRRFRSIEKVKVAAEELASGRADIVLAPFAMTARTFEMAGFTIPVAILKLNHFRFPLVPNCSNIAPVTLVCVNVVFAFHFPVLLQNDHVVVSSCRTQLII